jgi:hypothetical protein
VIDAAAFGVGFLLGLTVAVMAAFVVFFFYLRRQSRTVADRELDTEWSNLQRDSRNAWRRHPR